MQEAGRKFAADGLQKGRQAAGQAVEALHNYLEQGPNGLRVLAFVAGSFATVLSLICIINPFDIIMMPTTYILSTFTLIFSLTAMMMECEPAWIEKAAFLKEYQDLLQDQARFLLHAFGRGIFYVFNGSILVYMGGFMRFIAGVYMATVGGFYIALHYGVMPKKVIELGQAHLATLTQTQGAAWGFNFLI